MSIIELYRLASMCFCLGMGSMGAMGMGMNPFFGGMKKKKKRRSTFPGSPPKVERISNRSASRMRDTFSKGGRREPEVVSLFNPSNKAFTPTADSFVIGINGAIPYSVNGAEGDLLSALTIA